MGVSDIKMFAVGRGSLKTLEPYAFGGSFGNAQRPYLIRHPHFHRNAKSPNQHLLAPMKSRGSFLLTDKASCGGAEMQARDGGMGCLPLSANHPPMTGQRIAARKATTAIVELWKPLVTVAHGSWGAKHSFFRYKMHGQ